MFKDYKEQCENFVKAWIDKNTRFKSKDISLQDYKEFCYKCYIEIENKFVVSTNTPSFAGIKKATASDETCSSREEFLQAIQRHIDETRLNNDNFKTFFKHIENRIYTYSNCTNSNQILKNESRIYYTHQCSACRGNGNIKCDCNNGIVKCSCQNGRVKCDVWGCQNGRVKCSAWGCKGGKIEKSRYRNGQNIKYFEPCSKCRGAGFLPCQKCSGSGFLTHSKCGGSGTLTCPRCGGSTFVKCKACNTSGMQTEIATIVCTAEPKDQVIYPNDIDEKLKLAVEQIGVENFEQIAEIQRNEIKALDVEKVVFERYEVSVPCAKFSIIIKGKKYEWLVYGKKVQMLENGDIPVKNNALIGLVVFIVMCGVALAFWFNYVDEKYMNLATQENNHTQKDNTTQNFIKLLIQKDSFVNLRQSPNGKVITKIYAKNLDKITIKKLNGGDDKWIKVLYLPPNVTDETKAITGYIHSSKIDKNSLKK